MLKVVGCFVELHDPSLVVLAILVCAAASLTAVQLLRHSQSVQGRLRLIWVMIAALSAGSGIWATHFIAMLAYKPGVVSGYAAGLTALSWIYAVVLTGCGFALALLPGLPLAGLFGGALVGCGIGAMHYMGMAAFEVGGQIRWDLGLVAVSIVLGVVLSAAAVQIALQPRSFKAQALATLCLIAAIASHHFTGMGAVTIVPDPSIAVVSSSLPASWLAFGVAGASCAILLFAITALLVDTRDRQRALLEGDRMRGLANAAVEGLLVCMDDVIVTANDSFSRLVNANAEELSGVPLSTYFSQDALTRALVSTPDRPAEVDLQRLDGTTVPVELIMRNFGEAKHTRFALAVRDLRARRRAERQIQFMAHHDGLTGLANRTSFHRRFEQDLQIAQARGSKLAVLCLDLDRFKEVNDLFGHAAGDKLLQEVARVVTSVLDETQVMARLGGDEFAVLASVEHAVAAGRLAERILEALRTEGHTETGAMIGTSIGVAIYPDDSDNPITLLNHADTALYRAKSEGRGTYRFYESRMGAEVRERRLLEHDLRHAIVRGELSLVYQPQTSTVTGDITGFEALLRWNHHERGFISPALFIPIAEESGEILQIGEWVMEQSCRQAASWSRPLNIAVNVSSVQIHSPTFVKHLHETLLNTGLKPQRLEIEVTETSLIREPARALSTLRQVKALGVRLAMDDFGTGYSSLSNLRQFPFDKIKIDGSFIKSVDTNEQTAAIVRSVLGLGRGLGLPVLAEGVETRNELEFLRAENCLEVQGYYTGRPQPIESFATHVGLLANEPAKRVELVADEPARQVA